MDEVVKRAAEIVAHDWPEVGESDEIYQELWLRLLETPSVLRALEDMPYKKALNILTKVGHQIVIQDRTDYEYFRGNFYYSTKEVRSILDGQVNDTEQDYSLWDYTCDPELGGELPAANPRDTPGSMTLTEQLDLQEGLAILENKHSHYRKVVEAYYWEGNPIHGHAQNLTRAVDMLTKCMNNVHHNRIQSYQQVKEAA